MASLRDLREGLAANLAALEPDMQVSAYALANPTPPALEIVPGSVIWDRAMGRGVDEITLIVRAYVALNEAVAAQQFLDELIDGSGGRSVKELAETDRTLGGVCGGLRVTETTGYQPFALEGGGAVLMAEWTVRILAPGE